MQAVLGEDGQEHRTKALTITGRSHEPNWTCGHCGVEVWMPDKVMEPQLYDEGLQWIRTHRFGHLVDALENASNEELWDMAGEESTPITNEDAGPAVAEAMRIVRGAK